MSTIYKDKNGRIIKAGDIVQFEPLSGSGIIRIKGIVKLRQYVDGECCHNYHHYGFVVEYNTEHGYKAFETLPDVYKVCEVIENENDGDYKKWLEELRQNIIDSQWMYYHLF